MLISPYLLSEKFSSQDPHSADLTGNNKWLFFLIPRPMWAAPQEIHTNFLKNA